METARKITVEVPLELLKKARQASGTGLRRYSGAAKCQRELRYLLSAE